MGEEKTQRFYYSFRSLLGFWSIGKSVLGKFFTTSGFTLVELLLVIVMVGILSTVLITVIDPVGQINKARDATKQHDLAQIKIALDAYYNDHNRYPITLAELTIGSQPYIKDSSIETNYPYAVNNNNPNWNVLFAKLSKIESSQTSCVLRSLANCTPANFDDTWGCALSGKVDCGYLTSYSLPVSGIVSTSTPVPPTLTTVPAHCADGTTEQTYSQNMVACNGSNVPFDQARNLCGASSHVCTIDEYLGYGGATIPTNDNQRFRWINSITGQLTSCQDGKSAYLGGTSHVLNTANFLSYKGACGLNQGYFYADYDYTRANSSPPANGGAMCCSTVP